MNTAKELKTALDQLLEKHDPQASLKNDPLQIAHQYTRAADQEIAAIFAANTDLFKLANFYGLTYC